jgi:hypothetical protein
MAQEELRRRAIARVEAHHLSEEIRESNLKCPKATQNRASLPPDRAREMLADSG